MKIKNISTLAISIFLWNSSAFANELTFDIREYPFSHCGSYMSVMLEDDPDTGKEGFFIRDVSGERMWGRKGVFRMEVLYDDQVLIPDISGTPSKITASSVAGDIEVAYENPDVIRIRGNAKHFRLTQTIATWSGATYPINRDKTLWHCKMWGPHYVVAIIKGTSIGRVTSTFVNEPITDEPLFVLDVQAADDGFFELAIHQVQDAWDGSQYEKPFDVCVKDARENFLDFQNKIPSTPARFEQLRQLGAYVKWSSVVNPRTAIKRPVMYQSKNYMTAIWSWDNCFGAMAVANDHRLALDQLMVFFDYQTDLGILPDFITEKYPMYAAFKPPIKGLTMQKLNHLSEKEYSRKELSMVYEPIARHTDFWMTYMDNSLNGVPQYNNSNDCCDNSPIFQAGYPLESPDLSTHLIIQMDWLSETAKKLRKRKEAESWKHRADKLSELMIKELWNGEMFVARNAFTREYCEDCQSFMSYIPIMLGNRLPDKIRNKLLHDLRHSGIVTPYGPGSEHHDSPWFIDDGYWRGPVWAPHYFFLVEGLKRSGELEWARELALNFAEMCLQSGFPENFSSVDGRPLRDTGYSWTVDVFFALAHEYLR